MPGDESSVAPDAMPSAGEGNVDGGSGQRAGDARLPPLDERTVTEPDLVRHVHRQLRLLDRLSPWADGQENNALPVRPPQRERKVWECPPPAGGKSLREWVEEKERMNLLVSSSSLRQRGCGVRRRRGKRRMWRLHALRDFCHSRHYLLGFRLVKGTERSHREIMHEENSRFSRYSCSLVVQCGSDPACRFIPCTHPAHFHRTWSSLRLVGVRDMRDFYLLYGSIDGCEELVAAGYLAQSFVGLRHNVSDHSRRARRDAPRYAPQ